MFKKLFMGGLTMLLALALALSATPAFAQSTSPGATPVPLNLATITGIAIKETYPPQMVIMGYLPSACHVPVVTTVVGQPIGVKNTLPTLSVFVKAQPKVGVVCTLALKNFTSSLTLDARSLKVAPGKYLVQVNPINGVSRFQTTIVVR